MRKIVKKSSPEASGKINPKDVANRRKMLMDSFTEELEEKGVVFFRPKDMEGGTLDIDSDYLALPRDITSVPPQQLGQYLNAFTQHRMYMRTLIGWQESLVEERKREYFDSSHSLYEDLSTKKYSETAKERIINNTKGIHEKFLAFKDEKKKLLLLQYNLMSIDDAIFLVSREISRRGYDVGSERRNYNVEDRKYR